MRRFRSPEQERVHRRRLRERKESIGGRWEIEVLGRCAYIDPGRQQTYLPFLTALRASKDHQYDWNPAGPHTTIARDLFRKVSYEIWNRTDVVCTTLRFYNTLGGPADRYHGVDCFLEIDGGKSVVLIDLTDNDSKIVSRGKAYLLFRPSDLNTNDPFNPVSLEFVRKVVDILLDPNKCLHIFHDQLSTTLNPEISSNAKNGQFIETPAWVHSLSDLTHPYRDVVDLDAKLPAM